MYGQWRRRTLDSYNIMVVALVLVAVFVLWEISHGDDDDDR